MIRYTHISIILLVVSFLFSFFGSFLSLSFAAYFSGLGFILSLYFYKKITPIVFHSIFSLSLLLFALSPSPYMLAALFPLIGLFFAGENRSRTELKGISRYALMGTMYQIYATYYIYISSSVAATASHNHLSVLITYAILAEILYFSQPSRMYVPLILSSFILFGNRSAIFLLAVFIKNKFVLSLFLATGVLFIGISYKLVDPPSSLDFLFNEGGLLYRSFTETRGDYLGDFLISFDLNNLGHDKWNFYAVPQTETGFYDLHNSFLTIIVRDAYLGLFKILLWVLQIFVLPLGVFVGISERAFHDTFLLGGINDILLYALLGRSLQTLLVRIKGKPNLRQGSSIVPYTVKS